MLGKRPRTIRRTTSMSHLAPSHPQEEEGVPVVAGYGFPHHQTLPHVALGNPNIQQRGLGIPSFYQSGLGCPGNHQGGLVNPNIQQGGLGNPNLQQRDLGNHSFQQRGLGNHSFQQGGLGNPYTEQGGLGNLNIQQGGLGNPNLQQRGVVNSNIQEGALGNPYIQQGGLGNPNVQQGGLGNPNVQQGGLGNPNVQQGGIGNPDLQKVRNPNLQYSFAYESGSLPPADFLHACFLCKRRLGHARDIFMYRGDRAFCSVECRHKQIVLDEHRVKCSISAGKKQPNSATIITNSDQKDKSTPLSTGTATAA